MNRSGFIITVLMGCLTALLWHMVNAPNMEPPWPETIQGFSFSPYHGEETPIKHILPTVEEIDADLALLAGKTHAVRTYSVEGTLAEIPRLAAKHGINVTLGAWIGNDRENNERQIARLTEVYRQNYQNIVRVIVSNEALLREEITLQEAIDYIRRVKEKVWAPVSVAEPWHIWLKYPDLVDKVDFIAVHLLPYWEDIPNEHALDYCIEQYNKLKAAYPDKPIIIGEIGWPSAGRIRNGAVPSVANEATFLRRFLKYAQEQGYTYYLMEAFDQRWKGLELEGQAGAYWGVYNDKRQPKFEFTQPVQRLPQWRTLAILSVAFATLLLLCLFRDSRGLLARGREFLALVAYAIATFAVWLVYDFQRQYLTMSSLVVGIMLLVAASGAILVILAEAHEWAEALWIRKWHRLPSAGPQHVPDQDLPFVSVHVPCYNEPPDMMKQTLLALSRLDYPRFEVLVIDNNTKREEVWQPVAAYCKELGRRFRFYHVDPLSGFKAGALNFALRHTAADAEVVAVIDSDYQVSPQWLRTLCPQFAQPNMAIVQAPQDYRDGDENAFKAMCLAEYRGFFEIGMITRNERNAIIQHGTMTMVRRSVLEEVGGWSEWCITEDAELGLRIFERGYEASYLPRTLGRGLMPDTFVDYKKQRFRWAYGSVLILRHHLMEILGLKPSRLTSGQRYHFLAGWLPWFADGVNMLFNLLAIGWTLGMAIFPENTTPPHIIFACLPVALFFFKSLKMLFLYRQRVAASWRQSLSAGLAGLALSHTIARAMLTGFITRGIGFFRTPKKAQANALMKALADAREEALFATALLLGILALLTVRKDAMMLDVRVWCAMLAIQAVPYLAAVLVSLISGMPGLSARIVGVLSPLHGVPSEQKQSAKAKPEEVEVQDASPPAAGGNTSRAGKEHPRDRPDATQAD